MRCPACDAPNPMIHESHFDCNFCGSIIPHDLVICPTCRHPNVPETENCGECGEPLTLFSQVMIRHGESDSGPYRLRQAREQASQIKARGDIASQQRMQEFKEIDRRRIQVASEAEIARRREQRLILRILVVVGVLFILAILVLSVRSMLST